MTSIEVTSRCAFYVVVFVMSWYVMNEKQHLIVHTNKASFDDLAQLVCAAYCWAYFALWSITTIVDFVRSAI